MTKYNGYSASFVLAHRLRSCWVHNASLEDGYKGLCADVLGGKWGGQWKGSAGSAGCSAGPYEAASGQ
jgi:hypothetical protein